MRDYFKANGKSFSLLMAVKEGFQLKFFFYDTIILGLFSIGI
jgi:hypothetical protein